MDCASQSPITPRTRVDWLDQQRKDRSKTNQDVALAQAQSFSTLFLGFITPVVFCRIKPSYIELSQVLKCKDLFKIDMKDFSIV